MALYKWKSLYMGGFQAMYLYNLSFIYIAYKLPTLNTIHNIRYKFKLLSYHYRYFKNLQNIEKVITQCSLYVLWGRCFKAKSNNITSISIPIAIRRIHLNYIVISSIIDVWYKMCIHLTAIDFSKIDSYRE